MDKPDKICASLCTERTDEKNLAWSAFKRESIFFFAPRCKIILTAQPVSPLRNDGVSFFFQNGVYIWAYDQKYIIFIFHTFINMINE